MKTTIYFTTLLAVAVQVMVNGQTPNNQSIPVKNALLPVTKHQPVSLAKEILQVQNPRLTDTKEDTTGKTIEAFKNKIEVINKQISELEGLKLQVNQQINDFFVQQTDLRYSQQIVPENTDALSIYAVSNEMLMYTFQKQAEELYKQSNAYKQQALSQSGKTRKQLLVTAAQLEEQAIRKQIEFSTLSGKVSVEKFNENAEFITLLMRDYHGNNSKLIQAGEIVFDANRAMRLALEMREEASNQLNLAAQLGAMQNSEEKEFTALGKQNEVLNLFGSTVCSN